MDVQQSKRSMCSKICGRSDEPQTSKVETMAPSPIMTNPGLSEAVFAEKRSTGDWFMDLFGFPEGEYNDTQRRIWASPLTEAYDTRWVLDAPNERQFQAGRFWTPSLVELEAEVRSRGGLEALPGRLVVRNVLGDVAEKHCEPANRHATFQVASQFNCLEFVAPEICPERGVTGYVRDKTQGPACSVAAGPATVFRNYFVTVDGELGQTQNRQINNLQDVNAELGNLEGKYFELRGGYTLANDQGLREMNETIRRLSNDDYEKIRRLLRVGVHEDVQVTSCDWGRKQMDDDEHIVTQVFGSACSVSYSRNSTELWEPFARLVLRASYEATFYAALLAALRHSKDQGARRLFLTCLGGGVFGNDLNWIVDAMRQACQKFSAVDLEVYIVTYSGDIHRSLLELEREFQ
jgi:hypothetical protein